jgi:hypothetical protein
VLDPSTDQPCSRVLDSTLPMNWKALHEEGFALAAAAHGDEEARAASPGLSPNIAAHATAVARQIASLPRAARREWVRRLLTARSAVAAHQSGRPARALGLLADSTDKATGRRWLALAPLPRAGFVAEPGLLAVLRKLSQRGQGR